MFWPLLLSIQARAHALAGRVDGAGRPGVRMSQLRAAVRLCRLWRERGRAEAGDRMLRTVYDTFTEGYATADLVEAGTLLAVPDGEGDRDVGQAG